MKKITLNVGRITLAVTVWFAASCHTMNINSALPITIPVGLGVQDVKLAILSAVYPEKAPHEWTPWEKMTDNALRAAFGFGYAKANRSERWFVEEVRANSITVGFDSGNHYFRVEYLIEGNELIQKIDGSRNLDQSGNSIHRAVFEWLGEMESRIRESMGVVSALKANSPLK
jgi:hypothetical protein